MRAMSIAAAVLALWSSTTMGAAEEGKCGLKLAVSLPMGINEYGHPTVPVTINGTPKTMIIDTGAVDSMITTKVAVELNLPRRVLRNPGAVWSFYGKNISRMVEIEDFAVGRLRVGHMTMLELPDDRFASDAGVIGPDLLRVFDLDLDYLNAKVNFFLPDHCEGKVVYWAKDWAVVPLIVREEEPSHIYANATLDGHKVKALIDTGASVTHMSLEMARDVFDWDKDPEMTRVDHSPDPNDAQYKYTFKELNLNGMTIKNPTFLLSSNKMGNLAPDMILGEDILRQLHVYIAYRERNMYVTPASTATGLKVPEAAK